MKSGVMREAVLERWDGLRAWVSVLAEMDRAAFVAALRRPDTLRLAGVCGAGLIAGFVLFAYVPALVLSVVIALLCTSPAIALYWLGRLHHRREEAAVRRRAEAMFDDEIAAVAGQRG
jgi:hypothetical protein